MKKPKDRKGKIIFIDAKDEIRLERSSAYLKEEHVKKISDAYWKFKDEPGFAAVIDAEEVLVNHKGNLSVQLYVKQEIEDIEFGIDKLLFDVKKVQDELNNNIDNFLDKLKKIGLV